MCFVDKTFVIKNDAKWYGNEAHELFVTYSLPLKKYISGVRFVRTDDMKEAPNNILEIAMGSHILYDTLQEALADFYYYALGQLVFDSAGTYSNNVEIALEITAMSHDLFLRGMIVEGQMDFDSRCNARFNRLEKQREDIAA